MTVSGKEKPGRPIVLNLLTENLRISLEIV